MNWGFGVYSTHLIMMQVIWVLFMPQAGCFLNFLGDEEDASVVIPTRFSDSYYLFFSFFFIYFFFSIKDTKWYFLAKG